jgi:hypothetical protein
LFEPGRTATTISSENPDFLAVPAKNLAIFKTYFVERAQEKIVRGVYLCGVDQFS